MKFPMMIFSIIGCLSCVNMNRPDANQSYQEMFDHFEPSLMTLFPKKLPNNQIGFGFAVAYENMNVFGRLK